MAMSDNWFTVDGQQYKWDPTNGNTPVTLADRAADQAEQQKGQQQSQDESRKFIDLWRGYGDTTLGDLFNSADYQGPTTRGTAGVDQQGLYNWGNGKSSWVPMGDNRFIPQPQHQDSLAESHGDFLNMNKNGGWLIPLLALTAGTAGGAAGAEGAAVGEGTGAAISGAGTAEGVGAGSAVAGGTAAGGGTLAGTSGAATLTGSAAGDTAAGGAFVGDIPVAGEGGTSIYGAGTTAGTGTTAETAGATGAGTAGASQAGSGGGSSSAGSNSGANNMSDGVDLSLATDASYWNPEGGTTGLADPGATGIDPSTSTYGGDGTLVNSQTVQEVARQLGITPAAALRYLMSAGGGLVGAGLGIAGSRRQQGQLEALNNQYLGFGAPSRARYEASFAPGFTMANDPGYKDALDMVTKSTLHGLSVTGNPAGSPNAWDKTLSDVNAKFAYPALQNYRNQNANTGGIGQLTAAAPAAATGAIAAGGNVFNAAGAAVNDIFSPPKSLAQQLAELRMVA